MAEEKMRNGPDDGVKVAVPSANTLGESAVWSVREQALYWIDIRRPSLLRFIPGSHAQSEWPMPEKCCGVALSRDGVIVALETGLYSFDPRTERRELIVEIEPRALNNRLNEMRCDRQGRIWVGSMRDFGAETSGSLYRVTPELEVTRIETNIRTPNSLAWSPDGNIMYFADSRQEDIWAYPFDGKQGTVGPKRVFFPKGAAEGRPDGSCIDSEGFLWNTRVGAGCLVRLAPSGEIDRTVKLPARLPTSLAFGGPDLKTLFITTARQALPPEVLEAHPLNGHLLSIVVDVPGLPEPFFNPAIRL